MNTGIDEKVRVERSNKKRKKKKVNIPRVVLMIIILAIIIIIVSKLKGKEIIKEIIDARPGYTEKSAMPEDVYGTKVYSEILPEDSERRTGKLRKIKYIVIHETANKDVGANAKLHAKFLKDNSELTTGWHYTVDSNEIYHHIPDNEIAWHAGDGQGEGNTNGIGIELCINQDGNFDKTFDNAAKLVAYLIKEYDLNINSIKTHKDFACKDCPYTILKNNKMNSFKTKVQKYLNTK